MTVTASMTLQDGRQLAYAEYGRPGGAPAFYFHGTPGSLLEGRFLDEAARLNDVRLIAVDRPGYGESTHKQDRALADWPADVAELADSLDIDRFAVVGLSGGGPHAQACAAIMSERVTGAVIVSGAGSREAVLDGRNRFGRAFTRLMLAMTPFFAWLTVLWMNLVGPHTTHWMVPRWIDWKVSARRQVRESWAESVRHALKRGARAIGQDVRLFAKPWGFTPGDVGAVPVWLWHGDRDRVVPVGVGRYFAREIPGCTARFVKGAAHMMIVDEAMAIMADVREAARGAARSTVRAGRP